MVVRHDIRPVYIKINIYIYMYVNYSTEGSTALLDQAKRSLLVWMLRSVICLFCGLSYVVTAQVPVRSLCITE